MTRSRTSILIVLALLLASCRREQRHVSDAPAAASAPIKMGELQPGPGAPAADEDTPYEANAPAIAEGERLFTAYNCVGCHAHGGGGMGPALMDGFWIYGNAPQNIHATILEGRPNGIPSFRGRIPDAEVWKLTAYVRSLGGLEPTAAVAARSDEMSHRTEEQRK